MGLSTRILKKFYFLEKTRQGGKTGPGEEGGGRGRKGGKEQRGEGGRRGGGKSEKAQGRKAKGKRPRGEREPGGQERRKTKAPRKAGRGPKPGKIRQNHVKKGQILGGAWTKPRQGTILILVFSVFKSRAGPWPKAPGPARSNLPGRAGERGSIREAQDRYFDGGRRLPGPERHPSGRGQGPV